MADDDRKLSYSERDRMRREGGPSGGRPKSGHARAVEEKRSHEALQVAGSLFTDAKGGQEGKALADAARAAHGSPELASACQAYLDGVGPPDGVDLASLFLDAGDKALAICALDEMLRWRTAGDFELEGGLLLQVRILSEDFDDDLASRAEELIE